AYYLCREGFYVGQNSMQIRGVSGSVLSANQHPIPMGRKNWMFCWAELGAEHVGIIQSLVTTCKLHDINPYTYLTDVLLRVGQHPAREVADLTPRMWKEKFVRNPLRSDIYGWSNNAVE
ncbi:transposase domain-containing protein, partial [Microbulbifer sp. 2205BS26-8]|uniref:transposase domain-containing protein n=1 Tax=Microbulbifer sp. 2205BS26-8 TaxID=3064386 RepID=UPI00273F73F2